MSERKLELFVNKVQRGPKCQFNWKCKKGSTISLKIKEVGRTPMDINLCEEHAKIASNLLFQATTGSNLGDMVEVLNESKTKLDNVVDMNRRLYNFYEGVLSSSKKTMTKALIKELLKKDKALKGYKGPDTVPDLCHYYVHRTYKVIEEVEAKRLVIEADDGEYTFEEIIEASGKESTFDVKAVDAVSETIYPLIVKEDGGCTIATPELKEFKPGMKLIIEGIDLILVDAPKVIIPDAVDEDDLDALLAEINTAYVDEDMEGE